MLSNSTTVSLNVNLSSTASLNNLVSNHSFSRNNKEKMKVWKFEILGLGLNE